MKKTKESAFIFIKKTKPEIIFEQLNLWFEESVLEPCVFSHNPIKLKIALLWFCYFDNLHLKMFSSGVSSKILRQYLRLVHYEKLSATEAQQLIFFKLETLNWKNYLVDFNYNEFKFKLVTEYSALINISLTLKVCSAFRPDLKAGFLQGNHLRYEILKNNKLVGTVVLRPSRSGGFSFYGLSFNHGYINAERNPVMDKDLGEAYQAFYQQTLLTNPMFFNTALNSEEIDDSCF